MCAWCLQTVYYICVCDAKNKAYSSELILAVTVCHHEAWSGNVLCVSKENQCCVVNMLNMAMALHVGVVNPSTLEVETGGSGSSDTTQQVQGQSELHENLSQNKQKSPERNVFI